MASRGKARWQGFEELAHRILSEFARFAEVTHNDRIVGGESGTYRQIDVSLRWTFEGRQLLTIVQAKDWKSRADIKVVDAFRSVISDVGATQGILICSAGFTRNALQYAKRKGIQCFNLHDASSLNWSQQLTIPVLWTDISPVAIPQMTVKLEAGDALYEHPTYHMFVLSPDQGSQIIDWPRTFERMWNDGKLDRRGGVTRGIYDDRQLRLAVEDIKGRICWRPVDDFKVSYEVERKSWLGALKPSDARGFVDLLDDSTFTPTYLRIDNLPREPGTSWTPVPDPDSLAIAIRGIFLTTERFSIGGPALIEHVAFERVRS